MSIQPTPEALQLAQRLESQTGHVGGPTMLAAADELRPLHALTTTQGTQPTDDEIDALWDGKDLTIPQLVQRRIITRAIEAEVRKADTELIRQMLDAMTAPVDGDALHALHMQAITAARARLRETK